jgi:hypothetical protein
MVANDLQLLSSNGSTSKGWILHGYPPLLMWNHLMKAIANRWLPFFWQVNKHELHKKQHNISHTVKRLFTGEGLASSPAGCRQGYVH